MTSFWADFLNALDTRSSCANDGYFLPLEVNAFLWIDSYIILVRLYQIIEIVKVTCVVHDSFVLIHPRPIGYMAFSGESGAENEELAVNDFSCA